MQEVLVILIVSGAVVYLGQRLYKNLFVKKTHCDINCGCDTSTKSPVLEHLKNKS